MELVFAVYFIVINGAAFILMRTDKKRAVNQKYRISEKTLWIVALIGGAVGSFAGMRVFRHKTRRFIFRTGLPVLVLFHGICIYILWTIFKG